MSIMNFISHLGSAIARETDTPRGSARSSEIASEGKEGEEREEGDGPSDQPVGGGPIEPPSNKGGCGCFGYSRRVHHSSSETAYPMAYPREQGSRDGSAALRAHPAKISRAWGALRGSGSSACVASSPA